MKKIVRHEIQIRTVSYVKVDGMTYEIEHNISDGRLCSHIMQQTVPTLYNNIIDKDMKGCDFLDTDIGEELEMKGAYRSSKCCDLTLSSDNGKGRIKEKESYLNDQKNGMWDSSKQYLITEARTVDKDHTIRFIRSDIRDLIDREYVNMNGKTTFGTINHKQMDRLINDSVCEPINGDWQI